MRSTGVLFRGKIPALAVIFAGVFVLGSAIYAGALVYPSYQAYSQARQTIDEKNRLLENKKKDGRHLCQSPADDPGPC